MKRIVLFGTGNVATHLFEAYKSSSKFKIVQVFNHSEKSLETFKKNVPTTTDFTKVEDADIYILALKDDFLSQFANRLKTTEALVVHTSGSVSMDALKHFKHFGVFYPLQTFSKNKKIDFTGIPICVEANTEKDIQLLKELASEIAENIFKITSEQRKSLHVAAVFVSNFVNYLYTEGESICKENKVPFEILHPLILETASKAVNMSPKEAQTGPAKRQDQAVINSHLELLNEEQQKIYSLLTKSIQNLHGKEL